MTENAGGYYLMTSFIIGIIECERGHRLKSEEGAQRYTQELTDRQAQR